MQDVICDSTTDNTMNSAYTDNTQYLNSSSSIKVECIHKKKLEYDL